MTNLKTLFLGTPAHLPPQTFYTNINMTLVYVEGNIGAGKSTLLKALRKLGHGVEEESVVDPGSLFSRALRGDETFHLQIAASIDMVDRMQNVKPFQHGGRHQVGAGDRHQFMERGIAGLETFLQVAKEDGSVTALEYDLCTALKRNIEQAIQPRQPAMVLFLEMEPALCLLRVRSRSRKGEEAIALDYLERIHRWYHTILFAEPKRFVVARVKVLQEWSHEQVVAAALAAVAQTQETAISGKRDCCARATRTIE